MRWFLAVMFFLSFFWNITTDTRAAYSCDTDCSMCCSNNNCVQCTWDCGNCDTGSVCSGGYVYNNCGWCGFGTKNCCVSSGCPSSSNFCAGQSYSDNCGNYCGVGSKNCCVSSGCPDSWNISCGQSYSDNCGNYCGVGSKNCSTPPTPTPTPKCKGNGSLVSDVSYCCSGYCTDNGNGSCTCVSAPTPTPTPSCIENGSTPTNNNCCSGYSYINTYDGITVCAVAPSTSCTLNCTGQCGEVSDSCGTSKSCGTCPTSVANPTATPTSYISVGGPTGGAGDYCGNIICGANESMCIVGSSAACCLLDCGYALPPDQYECGSVTCPNDSIALNYCYLPCGSANNTCWFNRTCANTLDPSARCTSDASCPEAFCPGASTGCGMKKCNIAGGNCYSDCSACNGGTGTVTCPTPSCGACSGGVRTCDYGGCGGIVYESCFTNRPIAPANARIICDASVNMASYQAGLGISVSWDSAAFADFYSLRFISQYTGRTAADCADSQDVCVNRVAATSYNFYPVLGRVYNWAVYSRTDSDLNYWSLPRYGTQINFINPTATDLTAAYPTYANDVIFPTITAYPVTYTAVSSSVKKVEAGGWTAACDGNGPGTTPAPYGTEGLDCRADRRLYTSVLGTNNQVSTVYFSNHPASQGNFKIESEASNCFRTSVVNTKIVRRSLIDPPIIVNPKGVVMGAGKHHICEGTFWDWNGTTGSGVNLKHFGVQIKAHDTAGDRTIFMKLEAGNNKEVLMSASGSASGTPSPQYKISDNSGGGITLGGGSSYQFDSITNVYTVVFDLYVNDLSKATGLYDISGFISEGYLSDLPASSDSRWISLNNQFKIWDCKVAISGVLHDGSAQAAQLAICSQYAGLPKFGKNTFQSLYFTPRSSDPPIPTDTNTNMIIDSSDNGTYHGTLLWSRYYTPVFDMATLDAGDPAKNNVAVLNAQNNSVLTCTNQVELNNYNSPALGHNYLGTSLDPYVDVVSARVDFKTIRNFDGWYQVNGSGIMSRNNLSYAIPQTCSPTSTPACLPYLVNNNSLNESGIVSGAGIINSVSCDPTVCSLASNSSRNWSAYKSLVKGIPTYSQLYKYLYGQLGLGTRLSDGAKISDLYPSLNPTIEGILLVNGNFTIDKNFTVSPNKLFLVVASGNITIDPSVSNAEGVFVADGSILATGSNESALTINGILAANGDVSLIRGFSDRQKNNAQPAVIVNYRPDLLFALPNALSLNLQGWREGGN